MNMKISLNSKFLEGPYGGGMQFANYFRKFLNEQGVSVVNNLDGAGIDVILNINPFPFLTKNASAYYSFLDAYRYKLANPKTIIINRINECDERKGTDYVNSLLIRASRYADALVYIGAWLKPLLERQGLHTKTIISQVIRNGADEKIFNTLGKKTWDGHGRLKIVTHHWSANINKGHDVYKKIDELLSNQKFRDEFSFTIIGNIPNTIKYKNTVVLGPLSGVRLAAELQKHHVYVTASLNEPGGMHHIEGALCGLPILYINSGALPEYCAPYGLEFNANNLEQKLNEMRIRYSEFIVALKSYPYTASKMAKEYLAFIKRLYEMRERLALQAGTVFGRKFLSAKLLIYNRAYDILWRLRDRQRKI